MDVFLERCAGLDVHQASVVCCVLIGAPGRKPQKLLRSFGTTTRDLETLRAWLAEHGVTHLGMESTGVYWKPVYAVLEGHLDLTVGNAHHIKNVPGRNRSVGVRRSRSCSPTSSSSSGFGACGCAGWKVQPRSSTLQPRCRT